MTRISGFPWRCIAAAGCATLALAARADTDSPPAPQAKPQARASKAPATPWVQAASKHNGSGIRLRYSVPAQLQAGQPASVQLQFSGVSADDASVELRAPEGATFAADDGSSPSRVALPAGRTTTLNLRVRPAADGLQTLDIFTSQAGRSSAQSVPLKVGSGSAKLTPIGKAQTTPSGEKVISLPSQPAK